MPFKQNFGARATFKYDNILPQPLLPRVWRLKIPAPVCVVQGVTAAKRLLCMKGRRCSLIFSKLQSATVPGLRLPAGPLELLRVSSP